MNLPNLPGMGAGDVHLPVVVPERLRVVTSEIEVHGLGP